MCRCFYRGIERNIAKLNDTKNELKNIADNQKKLNKEVEEGIRKGSTTADEYRLKTTQNSEATLRLKQRVTDLNAELKDQQRILLATPGSIKAAKVQNSQLTRVRDNTTYPAKIQELNAAIDKNNELIDANSDKLGK